ncbi:MAG: RNA polymerase subunit sigma-54 [Nostoc sp. CmiVER01]|uniref:RNA polymerase factor sigma-54 n=1 Tax=Nostoc sp. CmiVER01 TaxID=3075384 RepID=UPI002AD321F6|nr:RNA polymerase subunit sigma-54 [Nostoc sp. CmiVER01]MDZ8125541.1 RNA polymerase subunit sigma-54 [Nostoc sp. CmiVER01]
MNSLNSASTLETHLETQTVIYPTLQYLVRFLPWDGKRIFDHLREECKHNPFIIENSDFHTNEALLDDILPNWYSPIAQELSLSEHLIGQISALPIPYKQREALIYLTQWLSNSGYLEETPEVWADDSIWSAKELQAVVPLLQSLDPPGIGTRTLQECLLIQLKDHPESLTFLLVQNYLEDIANCVGNSSESKQNFQALLQKLCRNHQNLDVDINKINDAIQKIQELEPRPARNFGGSDAPIVTPDLKVELIAESWQISLAYEVKQRFCLNSEAIKLLQESPKTRRDTQQLEALLQKARNLLTALQQWQENLLKVGKFLVERQQAFLQSRDKLDLVSTPQQLVAQSVGLSNSTVSRIVRGRYILVCNQPSRIIPLHSLCVPVGVGGRTPQQIQQMLLQLIAEESPANPHTDEELAQLLKIQFSLPITRRTVTKYRKIAGIKSSHQRKLTDKKMGSKIQKARKSLELSKLSL